VSVTARQDDHALLSSLGDDLKFVLITSVAELMQGDALAVAVQASADAKCERCWHYRSDVGQDATHPLLCGRCTSNLFGAGEVRTVA
jgi:isoleucyl-tRNA synthetase